MIDLSVVQLCNRIRHAIFVFHVYPGVMVSFSNALGGGGGGGQASDIMTALS